MEELSGSTPPRPWYPDSGWVDIMAVESEAVRSYFTEQQVEPEKIRVLGSAALDGMYCDAGRRATIRQGIMNEWGFVDNKRLVYCAIPPPIGTAPQALFPNDDLILENFIAPLLDLGGCNIIFGLHPKDIGRQSPLFERPDVHVHYGRVTDYLPALDAYVACISATIRWAIALGIPVINFDIFGMHYDDYAMASSVKTVYSMKDYVEALARLNDAVEFQSWKNDAERNAPLWGNPDGKFLDRFIHLVQEVSASDESAP